MSPAVLNDLIAVLSEVRRLLLLPNNDFAWSSWQDSEAAVKEIDGFIQSLSAGELPPRRGISVLFAPTGPIQEVSLSSGWGDEFLRVADRFDRIAKEAYFGTMVE